MNIKIIKREHTTKQLDRVYFKLELLVKEIEKKEELKQYSTSLEAKIKLLNEYNGSEKQLIRKIKKEYHTIIKTLKREYQIYSKNYFQNNWLVLGIGYIGLPIAFIVYALSNNLALFPIGIPIGAGLGYIWGTNMDLKIKEENRQLNIEVLL